MERGKRKAREEKQLEFEKKLKWKQQTDVKPEVVAAETQEKENDGTYY